MTSLDNILKSWEIDTDLNMYEKFSNLLEIIECEYESQKKEKYSIGEYVELFKMEGAIQTLKLILKKIPFEESFIIEDLKEYLGKEK
jgi:hypothetical protein